MVGQGVGVVGQGVGVVVEAGPTRCITEFVTEVVTRVCEETTREVCHTEYSQECQEVHSSRRETECGEVVVREPVERCSPGPSHQVCTESTSVGHHQECTTTHVEECGFRHRRAADAAAYRLTHGRVVHGGARGVVRGCVAVPRQECRSVPVHTPRVACREERGAAVCTTELVERRVRDCHPVEVPTSHTVCSKVPHKVCEVVPEEVCRSGARPAAPVEARQVCAEALASKAGRQADGPGRSAPRKHGLA